MHAINHVVCMYVSYDVSITGRQLWEFALQHSFFGHFCAGQDSHGVDTTVARLNASGLRAVLDYAAEVF